MHWHRALGLPPLLIEYWVLAEPKCVRRVVLQLPSVAPRRPPKAPLPFHAEPPRSGFVWCAGEGEGACPPSVQYVPRATAR